MMQRNTFEAGKKVREELFGAAAAAKSLSGENPFEARFQELMTEYCFGELWATDNVERKQRSIIVLSMLLALDRPQQFALHVRTAFKNGVSKKELEEILLHAMVYCGLPFAVEGFRIASEIIAETEAGKAS